MRNDAKMQILLIAYIIVIALTNMCTYFAATRIEQDGVTYVHAGMMQIRDEDGTVVYAPIFRRYK